MTKPPRLGLPVVMYNVTEACPLRCIHCYNESGAGKYTPSAERLQSGLEKAITAGAGTINFTGGEPFLVPGITDYVAYVRSRGVNTMLNTSGAFFKGSRGDAFLESLEGNLDLVKIGLSGGNPETNDYIRGKGNFRIATEALAKVREHLSIASCLKVCLDRHNAHEIETITQYALAQGVTEIFFGQLVNTGRAMKEHLARLVFDYDDLQRVGEEIEQVMVRYGKDIRIAKYCTLNGKCRDRGVYFNITAQGAVGPCLIREDLAQGNIHAVADISPLFRNVEEQRQATFTHTSLQDLKGQPKLRQGEMGYVYESDSPRPLEVTP